MVRERATGRHAQKTQMRGMVTTQPGPTRQGWGSESSLGRLHRRRKLRYRERGSASWDGGCGDDGGGTRRGGQPCNKKRQILEMLYLTSYSHLKYASAILLELSSYSEERSRAWPGLIM